MSRLRRIIALGLVVGGLGGGQAGATPLDPTLPAFTAFSQGDVSLASGTYAFNLGTNTPSLVFYNGPVFTTVATGFVYNGINVFDFHALNIAAGANIAVAQSSASGPIALLSSTSISMAGAIDVSASVIANFGPGGGPGATNIAAGGNGLSIQVPRGAGPGGVLPSGGGGGGLGGSGQQGGSPPIFNAVTHAFVGNLPGGAGGTVYASLADHLQGGSMGGFGGGNSGLPFSPGAPGFGGGAIELGAVGTVSIAGTITANGGNALNLPTELYGGGGGGSGGGVLIHGNSVNLSGTISALGGSGGSSFYPNAAGGAGGGGLVLAEFNGSQGSFTDTGTINVGSGPYAGRFDLVSVPEPSSLILLGMAALGGVTARGWRRGRP